jgi:hypothetical protein
LIRDPGADPGACSLKSLPDPAPVSGLLIADRDLIAPTWIADESDNILTILNGFPGFPMALV